MTWSYPAADAVQRPESFDLSTVAAQLTADDDRLTTDTVKSLEQSRVEQYADDYDVVWEPIAGSSQELALTSPAHHILYCGARGPGKTITQLMRFRARVGIGYGPYWRGIIFDREFKNLGDLVAQSNRFFPQFEDGCKWLSSASDYKWTWPTGEELLFRHVKKEEDYNGFHGWEIPFLGWNELTKQVSPDLYDKFMSINRSSFKPEKHTPKVRKGKDFEYLTYNGKPLPPIPLEVFSTTNPSGPGHGWVKKRFIAPAKYGEIVKKEFELYDPIRDEHRTTTKTQVAIFGSFYENTYLTDQYKASIMEMTETNPNLREAWVKGSWDITAGGAIDDLWRHDVHVIDRFPIPHEWVLDRSFDWGSSHPCGTVWWAEANGEEVVLPTGKTWCPTRGSLIAISEDYTCATDTNGKPDLSENKGLKLSAKDVALRIKAEEQVLRKGGWILDTIKPGPADNQIRDVRESDVETIEQKMGKEGVRWQKSDKSAGSRKVGLQLMRDRLQASLLGEGPGIYFMRNCEACIELLPPLPRDEKEPDDVDTDSIDHLWDTVRYRVLKSSNRFSAKPKIGFSY